MLNVGFCQEFGTIKMLAFVSIHHPPEWQPLATVETGFRCSQWLLSRLFSGGTRNPRSGLTLGFPGRAEMLAFVSIRGRGAGLTADDDPPTLSPGTRIGFDFCWEQAWRLPLLTAWEQQYSARCLCWCRSLPGFPVLPLHVGNKKTGNCIGMDSPACQNQNG
jgi:hypothetical protein